jgi:hypothetical protein
VAEGGFLRRYYHARYRLDLWTQHSLAPLVVDIGERLSRSTAAVLEYPFDPASRWGFSRPPHQGLTELFERDIDKFERALDQLNNHLPSLARIEAEASPGQPCWVNDYWTGLDALLLYGAIVDRRPRTYVEVGSGNSTLFARRAIRDHDLDTRIVSIDPHPRADINELCDFVHRASLQDVDLSVFEELGAGDVVVFDGSHTVFMNSDTTVAFLDVMPNLAPGVLVGVHDIFLPCDYPAGWTRRWYGEQYLLGALLLGRSPDWSVEFPAWYVSHHGGLAPKQQGLKDLVPVPPGATGSSLWMERRGTVDRR